MEGHFITFEGGEGAGKSTLIDKVYDYLHKKGLHPIKTREPGGTEVGKMIRDILLHKPSVPLASRTELFLFLADRAQHVEELILPALKEGKTLLCDRYCDSTLAYQGAARGFDIKWLKTLCGFATGELQPHLTLYLDLDPRIGFERIHKMGGKRDRIEQETLLFHDKIRNAFLQIAREEPKRFRVIDASRSEKEVFHEAIQYVDQQYATL